MPDIYPKEKFPCPVCGYLVHDRMPGSNQVCPICGWEDDLAQLRFPQMPGSANHVSLQKAQHNYAVFGVAEKMKQGLTRKPFESEQLEAGWRPLDQNRDNMEQPQRGEDYSTTYPWHDTTLLYYWRDSYWRKLKS